MKNSTILRGYVYIILSSVIYGCMPLMASHIYSDGVTPMGLVLWRNVLSVPMIALIAICFKQPLKIAPRKLGAVATLGVMGCALTPLLLFSSYRYMASGTATVLHFVYPLVVVLLEVIFLKKGLKPSTVLSLALFIAGITTFYTPGAQINLTGSIIALASGVVFGIYIVLIGIFKIGKIPSFTLSLFVAIASALSIALVCLITGGFSMPKTLFGWGMCLLFAFLVNVCAFVLFQRGTLLIGGGRASILSAIDPVTSVLVGILVLGEGASYLTIIGAVLIIAASVIIAVADLKKQGEQ